MKTKAAHHNKFLRIITLPLRALCKARDAYVKGITNYASKMNHGGFMAVPGASHGPSLPRSFSVDSGRSNDSEDFRELVRAASARSISSRVDLDMYIRQQTNAGGPRSGLSQHMEMKTGPFSGPRAMPPRSSSVAMGRIDEERPCCYFVEDHSVFNVKNDVKYPRSKSHAVTRRPLAF